MASYFSRYFSLVVLLMLAQLSFAAIDAHEFASDLDRQRYQSFIDELRCPKCDNQSLSGSNSPIAADLRNELYGMISAGRSDQEIVNFMVERYGEFILYRPRLTAKTMFLWALPGILLLGGALVLFYMIRRRRKAMTELDTGLSAAEQARLQQLLGKSSANNKKQGK